jgi:TolA-binding protein
MGALKATGLLTIIKAFFVLEESDATKKVRALNDSLEELKEISSENERKMLIRRRQEEIFEEINVLTTKAAKTGVDLTKEESKKVKELLKWIDDNPV